MNDLIDAIRAGVAEGADEEARHAGATACRTILTALEAKQGEPLALATPPPSTPDWGAAIAAMRHVPPDRLLELAIEKLRAAVAARSSPTPATSAVAPSSLRMPLVPIDPSHTAAKAR